MNEYEDLNNYIDRILPLFNIDEEIPSKDSFPILNYVRGYNGDLTIILEIMARGDDIAVFDESGNNALHEALYNPHCDMKLVKTILEKEQTLVNKCDKMQRTPLHVAMTFECDPDIVEELINFGADLNAKDSNNDTPLHIAANNNHKLHYILLKYGADAKLKNAVSRTPLIIALMTCSNQFNTEFIKSLLSVDCDINAEDNDGNSALYYAILNKFHDKSIVQLLLEHEEIDPGLLNISTCCSINSDIIELFLQYAILTKYSRNQYPTNKIVDKICPECKFCNTHDNKKKWYLYKSFCCDEIIKMKWDKINEEYSLYEFVSDHFKTPKSNWKEFIPDAVLDRYYCNTYPACKQLIFNSMKKDCLIEKLHHMKIPIVNAKTDKEVVLNYQCIEHLRSYLDKEDLINLILAFSSISFNSPVKQRKLDLHFSTQILKRLDVLKHVS